MNGLDNQRVLLYLPSLELGGSERFGLLMARHLKEKLGAEVEVWGVSSPGLVARLCEEYDIPWRIMPISMPANFLLRFFSLAQLIINLRKARPDIILAFTLTPSIMCGLVWRLVGARLCVWHQHDILGYRMGHLLESLAVKNTPLFISNCDHGAEYLTRIFSVPAEKIQVVYNAVQLGAPMLDRVEWRSSLGAGEDDFVAVMVANIHSNKDHATLLKSWQKVAERLKAEDRLAILALAGYRGDTYDDLQQLAKSLGVDGQVKFLDQVKDIPGLLLASDLGVFSSLSEGSPNGLLECMAAGLAVVGTDIPGIREAVGPEGYKFLVPQLSVEALTDHIVAFALSPEMRRKVGEANRSRIATFFNPSRICEQMTSLIEKSLLPS